MVGGRRRTSSAPTESSPMPLVMTSSVLGCTLFPGKAVALVGLERRIGVGVRLLAVDVPVHQLIARDRLAGPGAAHEAARPNHDIVAIEIADHRFGRGEVLVVDVHRRCLSAANIGAIRASAKSQNSLPCQPSSLGGRARLRATGAPETAAPNWPSAP